MRVKQEKSTQDTVSHLHETQDMSSSPPDCKPSNLTHDTASPPTEEKSSQDTIPYLHQTQDIASPATDAKPSNLTALFQSNVNTGNPTLIRCPPPTLSRLQQPDLVKIKTLYTPYLPYLPENSVPKELDPFEPLGRAMRGKVRHLSYRLEVGMTDYHIDFVPASQAIVLVLCAPGGVLAVDPETFDRQLQFCKDLMSNVRTYEHLMEDVPVVLVLVTNDETVKPLHLDRVSEFPVLLTLDHYMPAALINAARLLFMP